MAYRAPGVYSKEIENPLFVSALGGARTVGIVGIGSDYILYENVEVTKGTADGVDTIPDTQSGEVKEVVGVGDLPGFYNYKAGVDYNVVDNTIDWSLAGTEPDTGAIYYITYKKYKSTINYEPILTFSIKEARRVWGNEYEDGAQSDLTLAANLAFSNGASKVIGVQSPSNSLSDFQDSIDKLEGEEIYVLCVLSDDENVITYAINHVMKMSSYLNRKERILIISPKNGLSSISDFKSYAESIKNDRVIMIVPKSVNKIVKDSKTQLDVNLTLDSVYAGSGLAGLICNPAFDEAEPMTRKVIGGIDGLVGKYLESEMNSLAESGITVLVDEGGIIRIRHGITTDTTNANTEEISLRSIRDQLAIESRELLESRYIGAKATPGTLSSIPATLSVFLNRKIRQTVISEYKDITVEQDTADPRQIYVSFNVKAIYPITWIDISYSLYV